ncbi:MAG: hypothetical protein ACI9S8_003164 [Chlamydiales bacterium]|jgi:hypothetical protein
MPKKRKEAGKIRGFIVIKYLQWGFIPKEILELVSV